MVVHSGFFSFFFFFDVPVVLETFPIAFDRGLYVGKIGRNINQFEKEKGFKRGGGMPKKKEQD